MNLLEKLSCIAVSLVAVSGSGFAQEKNVKMEKIVCEGSSTVGPLAKAFAEYYMSKNKNVAITVSESGSGNGVKALNTKSCDMANLSRDMKTEEFKTAIENGVTPCPTVIALDGIAVIVSKSNKVGNLTVEQLRDIYAGKITNWKDVGGVDGKIIIITRDTNSGTYESFNTLVMNKEKVISTAEVVGSNGQARSRVNTTKDAIAYVGLGFTNDVKPLNINGIEVNPETIRSGAYAIARPLFIFTNGYPAIGTHLNRFLNIYLTKEGQEIIEEIGFVPVTVYE